MQTFLSETSLYTPRMSLFDQEQEADTSEEDEAVVESPSPEEVLSENSTADEL